MYKELSGVISVQKNRLFYVLQNKLTSGSAKISVPPPLYPTTFDFFTVEFWIRFDQSVPNSNTLVMQDKTDNNNFQIFVRSSQTQIKLYIDATTKTMTFLGSNGDWSTGKWRHVSVQLDTTQKLFMASLMFDFQTNSFSPQKSGFYFKGEIEFATTPAFCLQELRIWNHFKSYEELKRYAYTDMSDYHSGLLVSYWRLKPILNLQQLEDSSINPQLSGTFSGAPLQFGYDEAYPVVCTYKQVWDYTKQMCIDVRNSLQKVFKFNNVNSQILTLDFGSVSIQYNLEFWFKPDLAITPNPILFDHTDMWVGLENGGLDFKVYSKPSTSWPHQLQNYTFKNWNHLWIRFDPDPDTPATYSRFQVCLNYACQDDSVQFLRAGGPKTYIVAPTYAGYLKELRVWDDQRRIGLFYQRAQIPNFYQSEVELSDYRRFTWFSQDSDVFRSYMPQSYSNFAVVFDSSYIPANNYAPFLVDIKYSDNLQECELGLKFNGIECTSDANSLRARQNTHLPIATFNSSGSQMPYTIGFYFRVSPKMMNDALQAQDVILIQSEPYYGWGRFFEVKIRDGDLHMLVESGGNWRDMGIFYGDDANYKEGFWLYFYHKVISGSQIQTFIVGFMRNLLKEVNDGSVGNYNYVSADQTIYLGQSSFPATWDADFSIRDFHIDQSTGYLYTLDQVFYLTRTRYQTFLVSGVHIPFNESSGNYIQDIKRGPAGVFNLRDTSNSDLVWAWDPYVPIMCDGPTTVFLTTDYQLYCGYREVFRFLGGTDQIKLSNIGYTNDINHNSDFTLSFYLKLKGDPTYSKQNHILTVNPTNPGSIIIRGTHSLIPNVVYWFEIEPVIFGQQVGNFSHWCFLEMWCQYRLVKNHDNFIQYLNTGQYGGTLYYPGWNDGFGNIVYSHAFDNNIWIGGTSGGTFEPFSGNIRDLRFFNTVVDFNQMKDELINNRIPFASGLLTYYSLDIPSGRNMIQNVGPKRYNPPDIQAAATWPKTELFSVIDNIGNFNYYPYVQRFRTIDLIDTIPFPATAQSEWTLELRLEKIVNYGEPILLINNFIQIDGNTDGSVAITLNGYASPFNTRSFIQQTEWMQVTFIRRGPSATVTEMYVNGVYLMDVPQVCTLPTGNIAWYGVHNYIAIKDIRVWTEALPLTLLNQNQYKELDGRYFPTLQYYLPIRYPYQILTFARKFVASSASIVGIGGYGLVTNVDTLYCVDSNAVYDGTGCNYYKYLHMKTNELRSLDFPIVTTGLVPEWTVDFWVLFQKSSNIGDIVSVLMVDSSKIRYEEDASLKINYKLYPVGGGGGIPSLTEQCFDRASILSFKATFWKKLIVVYTSAGLTLTIDGNVKTQSAKVASGSSRPSRVIFCEANSCNFGLRHVGVWSKAQANASPRTPPIFSDIAYLLAYWPLDEGQGRVLYDLSGNQMVYPIDMRNPMQPLSWKYPHQISVYGDHLFLCFDQSTSYNEILGQCEPINVPSISYSPSTSPVQLKANQVAPLSRDWSLEFWLKFTYSTTFAPFTVLSQNSLSCSASDPSAVVLSIGIQQFGATSLFSIISTDLQNARIPNENGHKIIQPGFYFHFALVNNAVLDTLSSTLNFTTSSTSTNLNGAYDYLSSCDIMLGQASASNPNIYFQLKQLRIWSSALNRDELMRWGASSIISQGYPNLMLYYRLDNDYFMDAITGVESPQADTQYRTVADDEFALGCPIGFIYDFIAKNCFLYDYGEYYVVNAYQTWSIDHVFEKEMKDQDSSYTLLIFTYVPNNNQSQNILKFGSLLQLRWINVTYVLEIDLGGTAATFTAPYGSIYDYWFITFDFANQKLSIFRNLVELYTTILQHKMVRDWNAVPSWIAKVGYDGTINEYSTNGIKNIEVFRPPLTLAQMTHIVTYSIRSHFPGAQGLRGSFRNDYSNMIWTTVSGTSTFDMFKKEYIYTSVGYYKSALYLPGVCMEGTNQNGYNCYEQSNLVIQGGTLTLSLTDAIIKSSITVQGWYQLLAYSTIIAPGVPIVVTIMSIQDLFSLEFSNDVLTLRIYGVGAVESSTTLPLLTSDILGKWLYIAVILKNFKWTVYVNKVPIILLQDTSAMLYSNLNDLVIGTSSLQGILKVREISLFGHASDSYELSVNMGSHISQTANYKQLLAYYPMIETTFSALTDLSQFGRVTYFSSNKYIYWDYSARGQHYTQGCLLNEQSAKSAFLTRDKVLYFKQGATGVTKLGEIPASMTTSTFTLSAFVSFNSVADYSGSTPIIIIEDSTNTLVKLQANSADYSCLITSDAVPILTVPIDSSFNQKWVFVVCGHNVLLESSYLHINKDTVSEAISDKYKLHTSATDLNPAGFSINIAPFNGMVRELRIFSECLDPYVAVKLGRQSINQVNTVYKLSFYMAIDESAGNKLWEDVSSSYQLLTSTNPALPQWQASWETLTICDGHSRYSHEYDFCQYQERFLRFKTPLSLTFTILEDQVQNVTLAFWVNFKDFGITEPALQVKLDKRFDLTISTAASTYLFVGDPSNQALFRKDEKYLAYKNWVVIYLRIAYPYQIIYNYVGVPQNIDGDLTFYGNAVNSMLFNFNAITGGIPFTINMGTNSEIYLRNMQLWNSPFSLELLKLRILRGLNPYRFEKTLLLYFRFDESGGTSIFNTSPYQQRTTPRTIQDTSLGRDLFEWVHYIELGVNQTFDTEEQRMFLFCLEPNSRRVNQHCEYYSCHADCPINDCTGPSINDCINQTSLINPPSPRDLVTMFTDLSQLDCFECNAKCTGCLMAFANQNCTGCVTGLYLLNGVCGTTCPAYMHFIDGDCFGCTNPMCLCTREDLGSCTDCRDPLNIFIFSEQMCFTECHEPDVQYYDRNIKECKYCHDYCDGCTGPTNRDCKLCKDKFILFKGTVCVPKECPPGTYFDEGQAACKDCEFPCATCKGNAATCVTCVENYAFDSLGQCLMCIDIEGFDYPWYSAPELPGGGRCTEICGDGLVFGTYECDDGNTRSGDGCSSRCKIEKSYGCGGGNPKTADKCEEIRGPSFDIQKIMGSNRYIYLQFDKTVQAYQRNFTKDQLIVIISGVSTKNGAALNFDVSSVVTETLQSKGRLIVEFRPYFSIEKATIQVGFRNQSSITDTSGISITNQISSPYNLEKYTYVDPNADQGAISTASSAQMTSQITLIVNLVLSLFLGKALDKIWLSLNACQIIYLMPLMSVPYPHKLKVYLKFLEFANMDVNFSGDPFFFKWLNMDEVIDKPVSASFLDYDFEQSIFFVSYADKMQVWAMVLGAYPVVKILSIFLKHQRFDFIRKLEKGYRYNMIIRMITELYLEMTLHAFMNIYTLQYKTMTQALVTFIALFFMGLLTYFPALTMAAVASNAHQLDKEETKQSIGELYEETHVVTNKTMNQYWMTMFLFRRLVYVMILVLLKDYPQLQVTLCVAKTMAILFFVIKNMPFHSKMLNYQHIMNESLTGVAFSVSYVFTQDLNEEQQDFNTFLILSTVGLILGFNIFLVIIDTFQSLNDLLKMVKEKGLLNYLRERRLEMVKRIKKSAPMKILLKKKKVVNEDGEEVAEGEDEESSDNMETQDKMIIKRTKAGEVTLQTKPIGDPTLPQFSNREQRLKQAENLESQEALQNQVNTETPIKQNAMEFNFSQNDLQATQALQTRANKNLLRSQRRFKDEGLNFKETPEIFGGLESNQLTPASSRPERREKSRLREMLYGGGKN